ATNITGQSANLGPLADNGGPTLTHTLLAGSPAIDAGDNSVLGAPLSLTTDQRGAGFPRQLGSQGDIGAGEGPGAEPVGTLTCEVTTLNSPRTPGTATLVDDADHPGQKALIVTGTPGNDVLIIEPRPSNLTQVRVKNTGKLLGIFSSSS